MKIVNRKSQIVNPMPPFIPGLELARRFYHDVVRPLLDQHYPDLPHSAALIGSGSEILGFDDAMSTDHSWGPRLKLFLSPADWAAHRTALHELLARQLPYEFSGYATHFSEPDPDGDDSPVATHIESGPVRHEVRIHTIQDFVQGHLNFDIEQELAPADWLSFPQQLLLTLTAGAVYHDDLGLNAVRDRFRFYPRDVWLYLLLAGWARIGQEEHLMGRAGYAGDEIGSAIIGARLVRDIMRLCFLMERVYAPYPKWFGTAFQRLQSGPDLAPVLTEALAARTWPERQEQLVVAYEHLARKHNSLGLGSPLPEEAVPFFNRPFKVITFNGVGQQLAALIEDARVRQLLERTPIGMVDQFSDSTDLLSYPAWRPILRRLYE